MTPKTSRYQEKAGMSYQQMDCRAMDFPEGIFNVVIDKVPPAPRVREYTRNML